MTTRIGRVGGRTLSAPTEIAPTAIMMALCSPRAGTGDGTPAGQASASTTGQTAGQAAGAGTGQQAAAQEGSANAGQQQSQQATGEQQNQTGENEAAKFRRLFEKAEADRKKLETDLQAIKDKDLSELEKAKKDALEATERAKRLEAENLRRKVAAEAGVPADAFDFLTGEDEETLKAQATKLVGMIGKPGAAPAGTTTQPAGGGGPSVDDQITAAEKAGNFALAITLKRQRAGLGRA